MWCLPTSQLNFRVAEGDVGWELEHRTAAYVLITEPHDWLAFVNIMQEVDFSCSLGLLLEGKHIF
jgi:hypothetical protein